MIMLGLLAYSIHIQASEASHKEEIFKVLEAHKEAAIEQSVQLIRNSARTLSVSRTDHGETVEYFSQELCVKYSKKNNTYRAKNFHSGMRFDEDLSQKIYITLESVWIEQQGK
jgi:hypothetical protein